MADSAADQLLREDSQDNSDVSESSDVDCQDSTKDDDCETLEAMTPAEEKEEDEDENSTQDDDDGPPVLEPSVDLVNGEVKEEGAEEDEEVEVEEEQEDEEGEEEVKEKESVSNDFEDHEAVPQQFVQPPLPVPIVQQGPVFNPWAANPNYPNPFAMNPYGRPRPNILPVQSPYMAVRSVPLYPTINNFNLAESSLQPSFFGPRIDGGPSLLPPGYLLPHVTPYPTRHLGLNPNAVPPPSPSSLATMTPRPLSPSPSPFLVIQPFAAAPSLPRPTATREHPMAFFCTDGPSTSASGQRLVSREQVGTSRDACDNGIFQSNNGNDSDGSQQDSQSNKSWPGARGANKRKGDDLDDLDSKKQ